MIPFWFLLLRKQFGIHVSESDIITFTILEYFLYIYPNPRDIYIYSQPRESRLAEYFIYIYKIIQNLWCFKNILNELLMSLLRTAL